MRLTTLAIAGVVAATATVAAHAADLSLPPPPLVIPQPVAFESSGWYLRGDVGVGMNTLDKIKSTFDPAVVVPDPRFDQVDLGDTAFVGAGVGYKFNNWLRGDVTGEYRTSQTLTATQSYNIGYFFAPPTKQRDFDQYGAKLQSSVFLANGYVDLGTWYGFTPYVGGGVGAAYHRLNGLYDVGPQSGGFGFAKNTDKTDLAWAIHAGVGYDVTQNVKLEIGYRYLDMGSLTSNSIACQNTPVCPQEKQRYDLASHDFHIGMRWLLSAPEPAPYAPAPLIRKY